MIIFEYNEPEIDTLIRNFKHLKILYKKLPNVTLLSLKNVNLYFVKNEFYKKKVMNVL